MRTSSSFAAALAATILVTAGASPSRADLTSSQQKCTLAMSDAAAGIVDAYARSLRSCQSDYAKGKSDTFTAVCLATDVDGDVADAHLDTSSSDSSRCQGTDGEGQPKAPPALYTGAPATIAAGDDVGSLVIHALYGDDPDVEILTEAVARDASRCQQAVTKQVGKCLAARLAAYQSCKTDALAVGSDEAPEVAACASTDLDVKVSKACDNAADTDKLHKVLDKKCTARGVDLATAFPHCAGDPAGTHHCLDAPLDCLACTAMNLADDLGADCDLLDNGVGDSSCGCGDSRVLEDEQCDDGNNEDDDGCSASCIAEDRDGDGFADANDNCPSVPNPGQDPSACDCPCYSDASLETLRSYPPSSLSCSLDGELESAPPPCDSLSSFTSLSGTVYSSEFGGYVPFVYGEFLCVQGMTSFQTCAPPYPADPITPTQAEACKNLIVYSRLWEEHDCPD